MEEFSSERIFSVWRCSVGHGHLLIRSPNNGASEELNENIDLHFLEVFYMDIPRGFVGLRLDHPTEAELMVLNERIAEMDYLDKQQSKFFVLCTGQKRFYVGGYSLRINRNNAPYWG